MIIASRSLFDTPTQHIAYIDFTAPFQASESRQGGQAWQWRVDFIDGQGDGVHDDIFIRALHVRVPHIGETRNMVPGHGYVRVNSRDVGPQFSVGSHSSHFDWLVSVIHAASEAPKTRRLWVYLIHTITAARPAIPAIPEPGIVPSPLRPPPGGNVVPGLRVRGARVRPIRKKRTS